MKLYITLLLALTCSVSAIAQLKVPALSPSAVIKQSIGITDVTILYSRPSTRERVIFGKDGILPQGEFWRTGANAATKITFSDPVQIRGETLEKGAYAILSVPMGNTWKVNWYTYESSDWNFYIKKEPVLSIEVPVKKTDSYVRTFEMHFQDITLTTATLLLAWENTKLEIPVEVDYEARLLKDIDRTLAGPSAFEYYQAALYLFESNTDLNKALGYVQEATKSTDAPFFQVTLEAQILRKLDRDIEAIVSAYRALILSEQAGNKDFVRMNEKIIQELKQRIPCSACSS